MSEKCFSSRCSFGNSTAHFSWTHLIRKANRQLCNMGKQCLFHVSGDSECRLMGTHQPCNVDNPRYESEYHRKPAVSCNAFRLWKIRPHLNDLSDNPPQAHKRQKPYHGTDARQHKWQISQFCVTACVAHQPWKSRGLFFFFHKIHPFWLVIANLYSKQKPDIPAHTYLIESGSEMPAAQANPAVTICFKYDSIFFRFCQEIV